MEEMIHNMRKENLIILANRKIAWNTYEMILYNKYISQQAKPGQFLHVHVDGFTLRRPISIANINLEKKEITIIFKIFGPGTKKLSTYKQGMTINALGPNGNGFLIERQSKILLIGGGVGVPPLHYLGKEYAKQNIEIISILGYQD